MKLAVRGVQFSYRSSAVLNDATLGVESGEILTLAGPNGAGKTTLLRCINRIIAPAHGTIMLDGRDVRNEPPKELARRLGYVPQTVPATFPLTVLDTVLLGRRPHINWRLSDRDKNVAFEALRAMKLEGFALRLFSELSGGEKQKVLIARAICQQSEVLILDEPTSNLDLRGQLEVLGLILDLVRSRNLAVVMAMHDLNLAARFTTRIAMLKAGRIHAVGAPVDVITGDILREVYGVVAEVNHTAGFPYIVPLGPAETETAATECAANNEPHNDPRNERSEVLASSRR